jgi:hypothetical protein
LALTAQVWVRFVGVWGLATACVESTSVEALTRAYVRCKQIEEETVRRTEKLAVKVTGGGLLRRFVF